MHSGFWSGPFHVRMWAGKFYFVLVHLRCNVTVGRQSKRVAMSTRSTACAVNLLPKLCSLEIGAGGGLETSIQFGVALPGELTDLQRNSQPPAPSVSKCAHFQLAVDLHEEQLASLHGVTRASWGAQMGLRPPRL